MARPDRPPHIHAFMPSLMPGASLLVLKPFYELQNRGEITFDFSVGYERRKTKRVRSADLLVVLRGTTLNDLRALRLAEQLNKPVIYEIDDNFHAVPMDLPIAARLRESLAIGVLEQFYKRSTLVRLYSPALRDTVEAHGGKASLEQPYFDVPTTQEDAGNDRNDGPITLIFASARGGSEFSEKTMMTAVENVLRQRDDGSLRAVFWKGVPESLSGLNHVEVRQPVVAYADYLDQLAGMRPAIGLAPLGDDIFFRSKTNNKYREYGGLGIPAIYSDVDLYASPVTDGENGLLVEPSVEAWQTAIERLLDDRDLRQAIADKAMNDVVKNYSFEAYLERWRTLLPEAGPEAAADGGAAPVIAISGGISRHTPLAATLAYVLDGLGGRLLVRTSRGTSGVHLIVADDSIASDEHQKDGFIAVDVTLCGPEAAARWVETMPCVFALSGAAAANVPGVVSIPHPDSMEGYFDANGAAARLLPIAERLIDEAGERPLSFRDLPGLTLAWIAILPVRMRRLTNRLNAGRRPRQASGKQTASVSLIRLVLDRLRLWMASRRHLRKLRREKRV